MWDDEGSRGQVTWVMVTKSRLVMSNRTFSDAVLSSVGHV